MDLVLTINVSDHWQKRLTALFGDMIAVRSMRPEELSMISPKDLLMLRAVVCQGSLKALQPALMELHAGWRFRHAPVVYIGTLESERERFLADALTIRAVHDEKEFEAAVGTYVKDVQRRTMNQPLIARLEGTLAQQLAGLQVASARRTIDSMAAFDHHYRRWMMYVAVACEKLRDYVQAEAVFAELSKTFPYMFHAHVGAANMLVRRRAYAAAFKAYSEIETKCGDLVGTLLSMGQAGERHAMVAPLSSLAQLSEQLYGENFSMAYYQGYAEALLRTQGKDSEKPVSNFVASLENINAPAVARTNVSKPATLARQRSDDQLGFDVFADRPELTKDVSSLSADRRLPVQIGTVLNTILSTTVPTISQSLDFDADRTLIFHPDINDANGFKKLLSDVPNNAIVTSDENEVHTLLRSYPITTFIGWYQTLGSKLPRVMEDVLAARDIPRVVSIVLCPGDQAQLEFSRVSRHLFYEVLARVERSRKGFETYIQRAHELRQRPYSNRDLLEKLRNKNRATVQDGGAASFDEIAELMARADTREPNFYWLQSERGHTQYLQGKFKDTVATTTRLTQVYSSIFDVYNLNAAARSKDERHYRATKELIDRVMQNPDITTERCHQVARILFAVQDISGLHGFLHFWRNHAQLVKDHRYWYLLAHYSNMVGDQKSYQQHLLRAANDAPLIWEYQRALAQMLESEKRYSESLQVWNHARKLWRGHPFTADLGRLRCLHALKQTEPAELLLDELNEAYPNHPELKRLAQSLGKKAS